MHILLSAAFCKGPPSGRLEHLCWLGTPETENWSLKGVYREERARVPIRIVRQRLETLQVDAVGYGAKNTGGMGGGAAAAVIRACGPRVRDDLREKLCFTDRSVGTVVLTESHGMRRTGVKWVVHIISIIRHTPQGDWCPHPERLEAGVVDAIRRVHRLGGSSLGISALGTGEGRVKPSLAARLMIRGVNLGLKEIQQEDSFQVLLSLPEQREYLAFQAEMGPAGSGP